MKFIRAIVGMIIFCLGVYAFSTVATGIKTGEIVQFSKRGNAIMQRNHEPNRFWIAIAFWSIGGVMLVGGGLNMVRKNL